MTIFHREKTEFGEIVYSVREDGFFRATCGAHQTRMFETFDDCRQEALASFPNPVAEFKEAVWNVLCVEEFGAHEFNQVIGIIKKYKPWILKSSSK